MYQEHSVSVANPHLCRILFVPQNLLTLLVNQRQNCWVELSIILSTASQFTKSKVVLFILPFWARNFLIVLLLLSSQTYLPIPPFILIPATLQIIPSCGSNLIVDPFYFHSSLTNNFDSTSNSMFICDGRSSSWSGILFSWCTRMLLNSNASEMDVCTFRIACKMSACFLY